MGPRPRSVILGTGAHLPVHAVSNHHFEQTLETSDDWIVTRTGIRERRLASVGESSFSLALQASEQALAAAALKPEAIDQIICATVTPDMMCPSTACLVQGELGCRPIPAFDITAACSGFLYALTVGDQAIQSRAARTVLVIGADVLSRTVNFADRNTCVLFGDGAGAVVLSAGDDHQRGILRTRLYADGSRQQLIQVPSRVTTEPPAGAESMPQLRHVRMHGREVFKFAVTQLTELIETGRRDASERGLEISLLVPHQVNLRILDAAMDATNFPREKVMINLDRFGNTSAASVPIALDEACRSGMARRGDTILLAAFGGGLTWSSALLTL